MALPQGITGSTMPRRQLGRQLRDLRNRARMTTRVAAQRLEWSEAKIWRIETGQTSLRSLDVEAMCRIYGAPEDAIAPLTALARETKARGWWTEFSDVIDEGYEVYIGLEEAAARLTTYENELIPGLLQTEGYMRAVLAGAYPGITAEQMDRRVRVRTARQALLSRPDSPLQVDVVISEAVLWHRIGGDEVVVEQLERLRRLGELPNVRLRIVPADCGYHHGMDAGRFVLLEFPGAAGHPTEPPVVYVEALTGSSYLDKEPDVERYREAFTGVTSIAVDALPMIETIRASV
ncbi:helix-turn-helix domain-containing protein [Nocardia yamanashiensis]|uniref:helix-turn-helix domain-containing protein n=1 Tax=Nocardia yamanashiensis TaxID=209247 RepID=UPI001E4F43D1|nr:helix-turn-helix transcriptional regulator [Nocardia yamanashiensis]UGT40344.1 helix-turn-helix domain-containing protein [Nocardia yamanashiensis]